VEPIYKLVHFGNIENALSSRKDIAKKRKNNDLIFFRSEIVEKIHKGTKKKTCGAKKRRWKVCPGIFCETGFSKKVVNTIF